MGRCINEQKPMIETCPLRLIVIWWFEALQAVYYGTFLKKEQFNKKIADNFVSSFYFLYFK
jgi:uncharacterized membrane protein YwzB